MKGMLATIKRILFTGTLSVFLFVMASSKVIAVNYVETSVYDIHFSGGDVAVDGSGNIFIVDDYTQQVKKHNSNGALLTTFGGSGTGNGKFTAVFGIALDSNNDIFVVDSNRVQKFTNAGVYQSQFAITGSPIGIALDSSDNIYVTRSSSGTSYVSKYNHSGTFIESFGSYGTGSTQLRCPSNIKVDTDGDMYISDNGNARVQVWDSTGAFLYTLSGFGPGILGNCDYPVDIDTNVSGDVFVADTYNNIVKMYTHSGEYISSFDVEGNPFGLNVQSPVILVTSAGDTSLRRFTLDDVVPTVSINSYVSDTAYTATPVLTGTAQDSMSSIWSVEYEVDSDPGVWHACVAEDGVYDEKTEIYSCVVSSVLPEGPHTVSVRATDNVLNVNTGGTIAIYTFAVEDNASPVITVTSLAGNQTYDTTPAITGTVVDAVTPVVTVEYELASDPGNWTLCTAQDGTFDELSEAYTCTVASPLELGAHTVNIRATDSVAHTTSGGNIASYAFTIIDTVAPTVTTGAAAGISASTVTLSGNVTNDGGSAILERGMVYSSTSTVPTTSDSKKTTTGTTGTMSIWINLLSSSTHYYVRAFARNARGTSYGSVVQFTTAAPAPTSTPTPSVTPTPTVTMPASLQNVYVTFAKFKYNKYVSPTSLRAGDTAYIKNFNSSTLKLLQVFLYDYAKKGNQGYTKSKVTSTSMFLRTSYLLPTGKRYAYVFKFQDKATGIIATKYFVVYTTKTWLGKSVLGIKDTNNDVVVAEDQEILPTESPIQPSDVAIPSVTAPVDNDELRPQVRNNVAFAVAAVLAILGTILAVVIRKKPA